MTDERPTVVPDDHDRFAHDDAAYLFGALSPAELTAYEAHLARCPVCAAAVAELRGTASALSVLRDLPEGAVREKLVEETESPPDLLSPLLERAAAEHRRGRRRVTRLVVGLAGIAAAALVAAGIALATGSEPAAQPPVAGSVMRPAGGTAGAAVPIRATAVLQSVDWGTRITLHCRYVGGSAYSPATGATAHYLLRVVDDAGRRHDLGSWTLRYTDGAEATFTSGTSLPRSQIRQVQVVRADHGTVLDLRP